MHQVQLGKTSSSLKVGCKIMYMRNWVAIWDSDTVQSSVVATRMPCQGSSSILCVGNWTSCWRWTDYSEAYLQILALLFQNILEPSILVGQREEGFSLSVMSSFNG